MNVASHQTLALLARKYLISSWLSLDKVTSGTEHTVVLSAKFGQSDIRDGTYCSTKRKVHKSGKTLPNVPNMALVTSEGSKYLSIVFVGSSYPCGPILGLQDLARKEISARTYIHTHKRSSHIFIDRYHIALLYTIVGKKVTILLSTSLTWNAWAGCLFPQLCTSLYLICSARLTFWHFVLQTTLS